MATDYPQISVTLDREDKEALEQINSLLERSGIAPLLLSGLHLYSWANMEPGLLSVTLEDWNQLSKAIRGSNATMLQVIHRIIARQMLRHDMKGNRDQYLFWANYESVVVKEIKGI
ncbi:MAG: hypothetical protein SV765_02090 [Pseudomonadota bacterium]|nr:hypothetical protein [Pseudomonadota bacterium]